jgi:ketosteroid isomerase-like protein
MRYYLLLIVAAISLGSCNHPQQAVPDHEAMKARMDSLRSDLLHTDIAFSQLSEQKGRNSAFISFASEHATLLRPYSMPLTGKDSIVSLFNAYSDSNYVLTWVPIRADVAHSGELGFTYGTYLLTIKNAGKEEGTYCTVWKKDKNHAWKFVLDTGNEGLNSTDVAADKTVKADEKKMEKKEKKAEKKK